MNHERTHIAVRIALIYAVLSSLWIIVFDYVTLTYASQSASSIIVQTVKGIVFVAASALLIYALLRYGLRTYQQAEAARQTERTTIEQELHRVNRALKTLSECNQSLVRSTDEAVLLNDICHIIVDVGGYALAWVGVAQHDEEQRILLVAKSGSTQHSIESLKISWGDNPRGNGPAGRAIRTGEPCVVYNLAQSTQYAAWREVVASAGFKSVISLPLKAETPYVGEPLLAALTIYSMDVDAFDAEETNLLMELAHDLTYGVMTLRTRSQHDCAQEQRLQLASIVQCSSDAIIGKTLDGTIVSWNEGAEQLYGYAAHEVIGRSVSLLCPEDRPDEICEILDVIKTGGRVDNYDTVRKHSDGTLIDVSLTISPFRDMSGALVGASSIARDITERKQSEAALAWESAVNASLAELSRTLIESTSIEDISLVVLDQAKQRTSSLFGYVGYIDLSTGFLVCPTMTRDIWDACQVPEKDIVFTSFGGLWGWVLHNRQSLLTNTPGDDPRSSGIPPGHIPIQRFLSVPALIGDTLMGQIALANAERDYTSNDVELLERMAALYALAVQRKHAERDMQQYAERLKNLHEIDRAILAAHTPAAITEAALRHIRTLVPCQWVALLDMVPETEDVVVLVTDMNGEDTLDNHNLIADPYVAHLFDDAISPLHESRLSYITDIGILPERSPFLERLLKAGMHAFVGIPLVDNDHVIGAIGLGASDPSAFGTHHLAIVQEVADQLAIAIQHSRLFEQVRVGRERLQVLSRRLMEAQEAERRRIARELHDQIGQALTAVKISLQTTRRLDTSTALTTHLENTVTIVDQALREVRNLSLDLRPSMLDDLGLEAALRWYIDRQAQLAGFVTEFDVCITTRRLPATLETVCFRVVQEALTNVIRHAQAQRVRVKVLQTNATLHLIIHDDGIGFDVHAAQERATHGASLGLLGMQERVVLANGQMEIESSPVHGTEIRVCLPLANECETR